MLLTDNEKFYIFAVLKNRKNMLEENLNYELENEKENVEISEKIWQELQVIYNLLEKVKL